MKIDAKKLKKIFSSEPTVKLAYFFGSRAKGEEGPLSDYDFAVYLEEKDAVKIFNTRVMLMAKLSKHFKTDAVDLVVLNNSESPELNYDVIEEGILLYEKSPYKLLVEPKILNEYFDFYSMLKKYNFTKA
ncbi:MAG: nucleotidyltransferase domain-containing protein [bacterium]|nr:nucleotidyltransferase domain-containing protein [bacterium]